MNTNTWRETRIYLPHDKGPAIIAPVYCNMNSLNYEQENPIIVTEWQDPVLLSSAFRAAIQRFTRKDHNLYDYKITEWPAYRASALRSVRLFESSYQPIRVKAVNEAELFYEARTKPREEDDIELCMLLNRYSDDEEIGQKLLHLFTVVRNWNKLA